jgi:hypothetical protein
VMAVHQAPAVRGGLVQGQYSHVKDVGPDIQSHVHAHVRAHVHQIAG